MLNLRAPTAHIAGRSIAFGAVLLFAACGSDDDQRAGGGGASGGRGGTALTDGGADASLGSGGATGSGGAVGNSGAGSGGVSDTGVDGPDVGDAANDAGSDGRDAADASSDASPKDAGPADACADCWIRDRFPDGGPGTISVTGTIRKNDNVCVIVFGGGQCLAQNSPPCNPQSGQTTVTLDLTLDAAGKLIVEAPYQDMCAQDYFCAVSGPGCPIPTSYAVPTDTTFSYVPRSTDRCRRDLQGLPYNVSHEVSVRISGRSLIIEQLCTTHMLNQSTQVLDTRNWTTTIAL